MSASPPRRIDITAPAKLNLGLEVLGRRRDGYHDIATIFITIDFYDQLMLTPGESLTLCCDDPAIGDEENLALRAMRALKDETGFPAGAKLVLRKHIPSASGLGGASSDAAAALIAVREFWHVRTSEDTLRRLAAQLGSDVPFFLTGGCAIGRGRGDLLQPLPVPTGIWFVVVVPNVALQGKTARLYETLNSGDFSDGSLVAAQAARLAQRLPPDPNLLGNAFSRPLFELAPHLADLPAIMRDAGATSVALSGAGPAHYTFTTTLAGANQIAARLRARLGERGAVMVAQPTAPRTGFVSPL